MNAHLTVSTEAFGAVKELASTELLTPTDVEYAGKSEQHPIASFTFPDDPHELPQAVYDMFENVWSYLGYDLIKSTHKDAVLIKSTGKLPNVVLTNSYHGLSDGQIVDRQPFLERYEKFSADLAMLPEPETGKPASVEYTKLVTRLKSIRERLPDLHGIQGLQTYGLALSPKGSVPVFRQTGGVSAVLVSQLYSLGPNGIDHDVANQSNGAAIKRTSFSKSDSHNLIIKEPFSAFIAEFDTAYVERWQFLLDCVQQAILGNPQLLAEATATTASPK
jgi:hypothetical protein